MDYLVITANRISPSSWPILTHGNIRNQSLSFVRLRCANRTYVRRWDTCMPVGAEDREAQHWLWVGI